MSEAFVGLGGVVLGAVIAGLIARGTQIRTLRIETNRYWATRLQEAASDLVESYTLARSALVQARATGADLPRDDAMAYELRRKAQARMLTLPDGRDLEIRADKLRKALDDLRSAYGGDDDRWNSALDSQQLDVDKFEQRTAQILTSSTEI